MGGVSAIFNGENIWYTQAMVFNGKQEEEQIVSKDVSLVDMDAIFPPVICKLLRDHKIENLDSLLLLSPRRLMQKSPYFSHQVISRMTEKLIERGLSLAPF